MLAKCLLGLLMSKQTNELPTAEPLTREHLREYLGEASDGATVKGWAFFLNGKIIGVSGLRFHGGSWIGFSDIDDVTKKHKFFLHRIVVRKLEGYKKQHKRLYIVRDESEPTSKRWLERLGFVDRGDGVWIWQNLQH